MMFSKPRLEGRALEHALSGSRSHGIRMCSPQGTWQVLATNSARVIKREMKARAKILLHELDEQGFSKVGADAPVRPRGTFDRLKSIDLILRSRALKEDALIEVKWTPTRRNMRNALHQAMANYPALQQACKTGRWFKSKKPVAAHIYGCLVVTPSSWKLELRRVGTVWKREYPQEAAAIAAAAARANRSGPCGWYAYRGDAPPGSSLWPSGASHS